MVKIPQLDVPRGIREADYSSKFGLEWGSPMDILCICLPVPPLGERLGELLLQQKQSL